MGVCEKIRSGKDMSCLAYAKRYYQQCVLVNRSDVESKAVLTPMENMIGEYQCRYRVLFKLFDGIPGYRFTMGDNATSIFGTAEKIVENGVPQYIHSVNLALLGSDESTKCIFSQLDYSDYFAALQLYDGTVEIYGFEYGLTTSDYTYDPQNAGGGAILKLVSVDGAPEDDLPLVYRSSTQGGEDQDFNNNFLDNDFDVSGDFNDDFNDDFNNQS